MTVIAGFFGKLPARGDFVRSGLPRDFADPWDAWIAAAIAGSRASMGDDWLPAFLEAPVWRFALPAGLCGERAALGVMLPSVDRAGRYFPLTLAALFCRGTAMAEDSAWLDRCEAAGRAALEHDIEPDELAAMLGLPAGAEAAALESATAHSQWWTDGAPLVPATQFSLAGLPDAAVYASMLRAAPPGASVPDAPPGPVSREASATEAPTGGNQWEPPS